MTSAKALVVNNTIFQALRPHPMIITFRNKKYLIQYYLYVDGAHLTTSHDVESKPKKVSLLQIFLKYLHYC